MTRQPKTDGLKTGAPNAHHRGKEMKKSSAGPSGNWKKILCLAGCLCLFLAVSHAAWSQKTPDSPENLLLERHKAVGITCAQCHQEKPEAVVPTGVCSNCHPDVAKTETIRDNLPNPHNAHMTYPDCSDCHHIHKQSKNQCADCHNFDFKLR